MEIYRSHLGDLVAHEEVQIVPSTVLREFNECLCRLPWIGASIDWNNVPGNMELVLPAYEGWEYELIEWVRTTALGQDTHIVPYYKANECSIMLPVSLGLSRIDLLYSGYPNPAYLFGATIADGKSCFNFGHLLYWNGGDVFRATSSSLEIL